MCAELQQRVNAGFHPADHMLDDDVHAADHMSRATVDVDAHLLPSVWDFTAAKTCFELVRCDAAMHAIARDDACDGGRFLAAWTGARYDHVWTKAQEKCTRRGAALPPMHAYTAAMQSGDASLTHRTSKLVYGAMRGNAILQDRGWPDGIVYMATPGSLCLVARDGGGYDECEVSSPDLRLISAVHPPQPLVTSSPDLRRAPLLPLTSTDLLTFDLPFDLA